MLSKYCLRDYRFNFIEKIEILKAKSLDKIRARLHGIEGRKGSAKIRKSDSKKGKSTIN